MTQIATRYESAEKWALDYIAEGLPGWTVKATRSRDEYCAWDGEIFNARGKLRRIFEFKSRDYPESFFLDRGSFLMDASKYDRLLMRSRRKRCVVSFYNLTEDACLYIHRFASNGRLIGPKPERKVLLAPRNSWTKHIKVPKEVVLLPLGYRLNRPKEKDEA